MKASTVPCNGCTLCCKNDLIVLHPEAGDNPLLYQTDVVTHPLTGALTHALKHKPNGDCIYLGDSGCTIYSNRPLICRAYDCGKQYAMYTRADRKRLIKAGIGCKDKFDQGRKIHEMRQRGDA